MAELRVKSTGTLKLFESDNTSSVTIASPASLGADRTVTLPDASVTLASGTMLATDGDGSSLTGLPDNTPAFLATLGAIQAISAATETKILFDTETFDTDGTFASYKFTPAVTGKYVLYGGLLISGVDDAEYLQLSFYKNGSVLTGSIGQTRIYGVTADASPIITSSVIVESNTTDYFELYGYVSADAGSAEADNRCFFGGNRLIGA